MFRFAKSLFFTFIVSLAFIANSSQSDAQGVLVLADSNDNPVVGIIDLQPQFLVGVNLFAGTAIDLQGNTASAVVIPTGDPDIFVYIIGPGSASNPSPPFQTAGSINISTMPYTWQNTLTESGNAYWFP